MRIVVFSDSHGNTENMCAVIRSCRPDCVIFLGDVMQDAFRVRDRFPQLPFHILPGNCDGSRSDCEDSLLLELEGVRIFCAHGHRHGVKFGLDSFCNSVWCSGAALGLYGHTHTPLWQDIRGMQIMNPGSIGDRLHPCYGLVEIENGTVRCKIPEYNPSETLEADI